MERTSTERDQLITRYLDSGDDKILGSVGTHLLMILVFKGNIENTNHKGIGTVLGICRHRASVVVRMGVDMGWFRLYTRGNKKFTIEAVLRTSEQKTEVPVVLPIGEFDLGRLFTEEDLNKTGSVT